MAEKDYKDDPIEKKSYSKWWFLLGVIFFISSVLAIIDESIVRRSWKAYQNEFNALELAEVHEEYVDVEKAIVAQNEANEQANSGLTVDRLPDDPAKLSVKQMQLKLEQAEIAQESAEYKKLSVENHNLRIAADDVTQARVFAKADQDEIYYLWKHAQHGGHDYKVEEAKYWELEKKMEGLGYKVQAAEDRVDAVQQRLQVYDGAVATWQKAIEDYYAPLLTLQKKMNGIKWRGDAIEQVVIPDLGLVDEVTWGKVDRCMTCHTGIDSNGFEDYPPPFATHPHKAEILKKHPVEEFGCTSCHWGQGRATQIKHEPMEEGDFAHGFEHHWTKPLLRGDFVQSSCFKCHADQWQLDYAPVAIKGKQMFMELGCIGCHAIKGFEDFPNAGPSLENVGSKVYPEWITQWIADPRSYDPHTKMPTPPLPAEDVITVASYIMQASHKYEMPFGAYPGNGDVGRGKVIFGEVGCYGCHTLDGQGNTFAPTLDKLMEKTTPDWVYNWIQDPKSYHASAKMPSLRLTTQEATDVTAYLATMGKPLPVDEQLRGELFDPGNKQPGYLLVTQYGCYGCHAIQGTENLSKLSVDLSKIGKKAVEQLDFGDTDIAQNWEDWIFNKIKDPQIYVHERTSSRMPQYALSDEEIHSLVVFLKGLRGYTPPEKYILSDISDTQRKIDKGRRLVRRLNCIGCHAIEGEGGTIAALYEDPSLAPPNLAGEGAKVQPAWLFNFLKHPGQTDIRPWLDVRMPTFDFDDEDAETLVKYFAALDDMHDLFVTVSDEPPDPEKLKAGELLASTQYFSCFSCHVQGSKTPSGPKSMWGPDLNMIPERIRPDFLPPWIQDAQQFTPGVRMPSFLPEKGAGPPNILDGDVDQQAEAIRDYLLEVTRRPRAEGAQSKK